MDFSNILSHPDHEEIVTKLVLGESPKDISQWLKIKYTDKEQKHLHLSAKALQEYTDKHLNMMDQLRQDVALVKSSSQEGMERAMSQSLLKNKTYRERLIEYAGEELDLKRLITDLINTCRDRMEQVFDRIQENPSNSKGDYILIKYFETLFNAVEKFDKIVNHAPDQIIQHNITVQQIDQHVSVFQEAIRRTLAKMDPEASFFFMENLTEELSKLKMPAATTVIPMEDRVAEAEKIKNLVLPHVEGTL